MVIAKALSVPQALHSAKRSVMALARMLNFRARHASRHAMQCTLLVPDLFGPRDAPDDLARGLALASTELALARSRAERHAPLAIEGWLCQAFEVERQQDWPVAPLTLPLDGGEPGAAYWLRADPVHLQLQRDRVAVMGSDTLDLSQQDADAMVEALNGQFSADGLHFEARAPKRWYLRTARRPALSTETMSVAAGRDAREMLPSGEDAASWRQRYNELQMVLHALPINAARADAGLPAINSVWIWGGGIKTKVPGRHYTAVWSDDALAQALGAHSDAHTAALPVDAGAWFAAARALPGRHNHLVVIEDCARAVAYGDIAGWRTAIERVERAWMSPLVAAVRGGDIERLAIATPGTDAAQRFELDARSLRKFWTRPRPLSAYRS